jgi:hypothetical protein
LARNGGFVQIVANADSQTRDQRVCRPGGCYDGALVFPRERGLNQAKDAIVDGAGMLDEGAILRQLDHNQALVAPENAERLPWRMLGDIGEHALNPLGRNLAVRKAQIKELAGELLGLFAGAHGWEKLKAERLENAVKPELIKLISGYV